MFRRIFLLIAFSVSCGTLMAQEQVIIRGGTLVDVRDGSLMPDAVIVLEGDRIVSVSSGGPLPPGGTVIDASGKYILPGLIDLHVHYKDWAVELYLNHGVTTVVDLGSMHEWMKAQKEGIQSGLIPGPRLFHSPNIFEGPPADGTSFTKPFVHTVEDPEEAMFALRQYVTVNVDAVKVYAALSDEVLRALVREANRANIPVIGHFRDVRIAAAVGAHGIEHTGAVASTVVDRPAYEAAVQRAKEEAMKTGRTNVAVSSSAFVDWAKVPEVMQLMVKSNLYLNPTFAQQMHSQRAVREKGFHYEDFDLLLNNWDLRYIPLQWKLADLKEFQEVGLWNWRDLTQYELDLHDQSYENAQRLVKAFVDAGGKLYAGTDCANMCTPGLGTHQELELLVDAGVSPLQALQAATINSAELMRMGDRLGTIEVGKVGDVVVLDANPLEDIRNTRKIYKVISRGQVLDGQYHADFKNPIPKNDTEGTSHLFPSPRILWASPEAFVEGMQATLTVHGTGFIPYSIVQFNGRKLKTNFIDGFQLAAEVPAKLLEPGTYAVTVENPDFAWGTHNARGAWDLWPLGIRDHVSNKFLVLVKPIGGAPIFPHPREAAQK